MHFGQDIRTGADFHLPVDSFKTHYHLIGGTGKGKTTAIHTVLRPLLRDPFQRSCFFIVDRLGNFSQELLLWMASDFCPEYVRERLVYIRPSREDVVLTFNPLLHESPEHAYYKVGRATEIILRAWESVNIEAMPRLARWTANAFLAAAHLGLTIADCVHLLMPGSEWHAPLLELLPVQLQAEWREILDARGGEAGRILESSRNRLKPYFDSGILRRMFGSTVNRLDVLKFMREGKIVLIDLAPGERLAYQLANTIGALILNEVLATARSLPRGVRYPTYLLLDEFQNFIGPDIEHALPEVRQLGLRLILSHQSLSQLVQGDQDLRAMIFQAQSRIVFGVQGEDADLLAQEVASLTFDPKWIKDEVYSRRQLHAGFRKQILRTGGTTATDTDAWQESRAEGRQQREGKSRDEHFRETTSDGSARTDQNTRGRSGSNARGTQEGWGEHLVPEFDEFLELASRTYFGFEEQKQLWASRIRKLKTGRALVRLVDDPELHEIDVKRSAPGFLRHDVPTIARLYPQALDALDRLVERNFASDCFVSAHVVDREAQARLHAVLRPTIDVRPISSTAAALDSPATSNANPTVPDPFG